MSTKIYTGWRVRTSHLNEFLDLIRAHMFTIVLTDVDSLAGDVKDEAVAERMKRISLPAYSQEATERGMRVEIVLELAKKPEFRQSILALDCGVNVWLDGGLAYVIPWGHPNRYATFEAPEWVEDYPYWDNTDRPNDIPASTWRQRGRNWDRVVLDRWDSHRLIYHVVDMDFMGRGQGEITMHYLRLAHAEARGEGNGE